MELDIIQYQFVMGSIIFWCAFLLCDLSLKNNISKMGIYPIACVFYAGISCFYFLYPPVQSIPFITYLFALSLLLLLPFLYRNKISKIIFVLLSSILFSYIASQIAIILVNILPMFFMDIDFISYYFYITLSVHALYLLSILVFLRILFRKAVDCIGASALYIIWLYPILCFLALYQQSDFTKVIKISDEGLSVYICIILLIYVSYLMIYLAIPKRTSHVFSSLQEMRNPIENKAEPIKELPTPQKEIQKVYVNDEELILKGEKKYYEQIINTYYDMTSRTKELDKQLHALNHLLINENLAAAKAYLDQISRAFHDVDMLIVSDRPIINSLISYYHYICLKNRIRFDVKINIPRYVQLDESDFCILLGTILINAIEACQFIAPSMQRFINLDCRVRNDELLIICDNSFDGFINRSDDGLKSKKKQEGMGLNIIKSICNKYRGRMDIEYPQNIFSIYIMLPFTNNKENNVR